MSNTINLNVPFLSQLDNRYAPFGTCNLTCCAMVMRFYGIVGDGSLPQLEDQLFREYGDRRWYPETMVEALASKGIRSEFRVDATIAGIKAHLDKGNPCIVHGYFTPSGHIIVIRGYDDKGFFVNDPYGEYHRSGYDTSVSGENLHYSYNMIRETCQDEVGIWCHFTSRSKP